MRHRFPLLLALLALACFAIGQRNPMMSTSKFMLASMPDTKKELKITKAQDKAIQELLKSFQKDMQGGGMMIDFSNPLAALDPKIEALLDAGQVARLNELYVQANGGFVLNEAKFVEALQLSPEVVDKIKALKQEWQSYMMSEMKNLRTNNALKALQKKREAASASMIALLSAEQQAKFAAMQGKPFKFKD